ncbi:MAG: T9SS type A sorting domain-containing protein [Flavobacteriales bacterium]
MKYLYSIIALITALALQAQRYQFNISTATYTPLTDATVLDLPEFWDDPEDVVIVMPFQTSIFGTGPYQFGVFDGYFDFSLVNPQEAVGFLAFGGYDFIYKPGCIVRHKTEGTAPNRIFKIEFVNVGFYSFEDSNDFFNGQIWVHENGCFSAHIGTFDITNSQELTAGLFFLSDLDSVAFVQGNIASTSYSEITLDEFQQLSNDPLLAGVPATNTVFQFCPRPTSVGVNEVETNLNIFPNPAKDKLFIHSDEKNIAHLQIMSLDGKTIHNAAHVMNQQNSLDVSALHPGIFLIQITFENGAVVKRKFIKQ